MKNCAPPLSGRPGWSTAATAPRAIGVELNSAFSMPKPPVPTSDAFDGSFDSGSPPWTMPMRTARWKVVPAYAPSCASFMK